MSEINGTNRKIIRARLFPDEGFHETIRELVEFKRDNMQVDAEF